MLFYWDELLPSAMKHLNPLHRELIKYLMTLPGKKRPSYKYTLETWNLDRSNFEAELEAALAVLRQKFSKLGIASSNGLDMR